MFADSLHADKKYGTLGVNNPAQPSVHADKVRIAVTSSTPVVPYGEGHSASTRRFPPATPYRPGCAARETSSNTHYGLQLQRPWYGMAFAAAALDAKRPAATRLVFRYGGVRCTEAKNTDALIPSW